MHGRNLSFQSGANLRSSKQQSVLNLKGLDMDEGQSSRVSGRTNSAFVGGDPSRRGPALTTWPACLRRSAKEWALILIMIGLLGYTELGTAGRKMYITDHMLESIKFPHEKSTVPSWSVPVYSVFGPPVIMVMHGALVDLPVSVRHSSVLGVVFSTIVSALSTNVFKLTVGRPRPDWFYRCWPDGIQKWKDDIETNGLRWPDCHPKDSGELVDGYKSFPSGHTSWTFGSFMFLSLYLFYFIRPAGAADALDLLLVLFPLMVAGWVGMTRVIDNYHNPSDVLAGGLLGAAIAIFTFYAHFPGLWGMRKTPLEGSVQSRPSEAEMLPV